ncbi:hypothetical protein [Mucilaginibacter segetis]|uniref:Uncharacterized protein n=1 Tax=Mucilaginibacter segetis TaxID=2793071 RepID=A0A934PV33_9SPHI|nr:hypothetical protein [Mucilaginibacter segetis]MBK0380101.1 hypothetical protein [Mucilaginibacter segetis]
MKQISACTRPRPVIELDNTPFYVDAQWLYLVQVGNPDNRIDMHEARSFKSHVELWYDPSIKNAYQGSHSDPPPEHILNYWFHSFSALDPAGAAARLDELNPEWRSENHTGLPVIDIAGKLFYVDKKDGCFYEVNNCWNWISFNDIACRKKMKGLYINLNSHNTAFPHELNAVRSLTSLPDHLFFAPIPNRRTVKKIIEKYLQRNKK